MLYLASLLYGKTYVYILVGADIKEMKDNSFATNLRHDFIAKWNNISKSKKPLIAAVNGYAVSDGVYPRQILPKKCSESFDSTHFRFVVGWRERARNDV